MEQFFLTLDGLTHSERMAFSHTQKILRNEARIDGYEVWKQMYSKEEFPMSYSYKECLVEGAKRQNAILTKELESMSLAFAMASHPRLGQNSVAGAVEIGLFQQIMNFY